jgi:Family of unknown function (DUF5343)
LHRSLTIQTQTRRFTRDILAGRRICCLWGIHSVGCKLASYVTVLNRTGDAIMAEIKKSYPMLPVAHWWALRKKFKQSIPTVVNQSYLAGVLRMEAQSARANVLPYLKVLGIINEDGKPTDRAKEWRDDARYPAVCKSILTEVYPPELLDAVTDPTQREQADSWFSHATGGGEAAVARMAVLYCVLLEGDASKQPDDKPERARPVPAPLRFEPERVEPAPNNTPTNLTNLPQMPVNINLEIHISADSSAEQIDTIFKSMAKHIYQRG